MDSNNSSSPRRRVALALVFFFIAVGIAALASRPWGDRIRETRLKDTLFTFREALAAYERDHGFFPAAPGDFNEEANVELLGRQLTERTDARGAPSPTASAVFCFGPYLERIPSEPVTGSILLVVTPMTDRLLPDLAEAVRQGTGQGGWHYEPRSGNLVANLGADFEKPYAMY
jgi:hypothetical protein